MGDNKILKEEEVKGDGGGVGEEEGPADVQMQSILKKAGGGSTQFQKPNGNTDDGSGSPV